MRTVFAFTILLVTGVVLDGDTRESVKNTLNGIETVSTSYRQGNNYRWEDGSHVVIQNFQKSTTYVLDPSSKQYVQGDGRPGILMSLAFKIARPPRVQESGKTVNVYYETVDTGERKQVFGYTARHVLSKARYVAEAGACLASRETQTDGWYITLPNQASGRGEVRLGFGGWRCQDTVMEHGAPTPLGFAVIETRGSMTTEVLEYWRAPLNHDLFEVPAGFQRVEALPGEGKPITWSQQLGMEWMQLERAVESWFD